MNHHGITPEDSFVTPQKKTYYEHDGVTTIELWLVAEERYGDTVRFEIVIDERTKQFGLATFVVWSGDGLLNNKDWYMGCYGTFAETFDGM